MGKINISFIQYGGLSYGGAHKQALDLANILDKDKFRVRYFWSKPVKDLYSDFVHPVIDIGYTKKLVENGVEPIEFNLETRDISHPYHPWLGSNFFEVFKRHETDIIFSVRAGHPEFPFVHLNLPVVEWNVFGQSDSSQNLVASVAVSPWVQKEFFKNGGRPEISSVCFPAISFHRANENLKAELNIRDGEVVLGFHQRVDDGIFGRHALEAFKKVKDQTKKPLRFLVLGGSEKYKALAKELNVNVEFLPLTMGYERVSMFLNSLDIFCHSAGLGESVGLAVMEAMVHGLPVVSMKSWNNGHVDVIGDTLKVAENVEAYVQNLLRLVEDDSFRKSVGQSSFNRAKACFSFERMGSHFQNIFGEVFQKFCLEKKYFEVLPQNIYDKFSFKRTLYGLLWRFPFLFQSALKFNRWRKDL